MSGQRACSNPLCEHFWRMVPNDWDHFAWVLKEPVPPVPTEEPIELTTESNARRLGRVVWKWIVAPEDQYDFQPPWCAKYIWHFSHEVARDVLTEWYYFCTDCNEVLEKVNEQQKGS